jgi:hypothetical protein
MVMIYEMLDDPTSTPTPGNGEGLALIEVLARATALVLSIFVYSRAYHVYSERTIILIPVERIIDVQATTVSSVPLQAAA